VSVADMADPFAARSGPAEAVALLTA
jgi:hypothetical protein